MSKLREQMIRDMTIKGLSQKTIHCYTRYIIDFAKHYRKSPDLMGAEEMKNYLAFLLNERKLSNEYIRGVYCAMKFLYGTTLALSWDSFKIPQLRRKRSTPQILSDKEIQLLIDHAPQPKYKTLFILMFATGMRVSEACSLQVVDVERDRKIIQIRNGKGAKDRITMLSPSLMEELDLHFKEYNPEKWVFAGDKPDQHITTRSAQRAFTIALEKSSVTKLVSSHNFRHTFATRVIEMGNDVYRLQMLMGHSSVRTTSRYIHMSNHSALEVESPYEKLKRDLKDAQ